MIEFNHYQNETRRTAGKPKTEGVPEIVVLALGLTGEAGEAADILKKHFGHGHDLDKQKVAKELGDVLWYVARMADELGFKLSEVAEMNVEKLRARYPQGFSTEASIARVDTVKT